jgi:site-specific DNA recombinase
VVMAKEKVVGYLRVSTMDQALEGVSLEAQRERIKNYCLGADLELCETFMDAGISGGRADNRPGLQDAIDFSCKHRAAIIVYSLSRLGRSTADILAITARLESNGADLISLSEKIDTSSAAGKMIFRLLAVLSEFERDLVVERTKGAMSHLRGQNRRISRYLPYGYNLGDDKKILISCPREMKVIDQMKKLRESGQSYNVIAKSLNQEKNLSKAGKLWSGKTVRGVLLRAETCK